jgi:flagellin-like protein
MKLNKKGISPVIATVIIVAVAIAVAIAVAYWVTGIIPAFTRYEELKISTSIVNGPENATIVVKNTGSADATLDQVLVNGKLNASAGWDSDAIQLEPGQTATIDVFADGYDVLAFQPGVVYDFTVHTAGGGSYPASARAP